MVSDVSIQSRRETEANINVIPSDFYIVSVTWQVGDAHSKTLRMQSFRATVVHKRHFNSRLCIISKISEIVRASLVFLNETYVFSASRKADL